MGEDEKKGILSEAPKKRRYSQSMEEFAVAEADGETDGGDRIHWAMGTTIFINALVGVGLLNFPQSIHNAGGIVTAAIVQAVLVSLLFSSVLSMVWCAERKRCPLYQDTVEAYLGWIGKLFCVLAMTAFTFLLTSMYSTVIGRQLRIGFMIVTGLDEGPWYTQENFWLVVSMLFIIFPLCFVKNIGSLHHASAVATVSLLFVVAIIIYEYFDTEHEDVGAKLWPDKNWRSIVNAIPAYSVAYMFDLCSVAVYDRLAVRSVSTFIKSAGTAIVLVYVFFNTVGGVAYATFGANIKANFMENYTTKNWLVAAAQLLFGFKLCLEYPVYQYLGWTAIRSLLVSGGGSRVEAVFDRSELLRVDPCRGISSAIWIAITSITAIYAESIANILPLTSVVVLQFQFTLPGLTLGRAIWEDEKTLSGRRRAAAAFGAAFFVCTGLALSSLVFVNFVMGKSLPPV